MKLMPGLRGRRYVKKVGIFLITVALIAGMMGCDPVQFALDVLSTMGGTVTVLGEGTPPYRSGAVVDLVAISDPGYRFAEWTGDVDGIDDVTSSTITITMNRARSITAKFIAQYDLAMGSTVGGELTIPGEGTFTYDAGTVVALVAIPDAGYRFVEWTGNVGTIADVNAVSTTIIMNGAYTITAKFIAQYDLTISSADGGEVTTPGEGTFTYDAGTVVALVAEAEESYHFVEWTGNVSTIADVNSAATTITMSDHYSITANFILFAGGSGTEGDPYRIADWRQLDNVRNHLDGHFVLVNDLDSTTTGYAELASATANDGNGWQPIGTCVDLFTGTFDGQGYEISDLFIARPGESGVGLFGVVRGEGVIENVGVVSGNVTGKDNVGGLVGKNEGTVSNSYASGSVTGNSNIGGLVGKNEKTVSSSFWDTETSGQATSDGGTGKTMTQMKDIATFTDTETEGLDEPWDMCAVDPGETNDACIWNIVDGETYPFLSWQAVA